MTKITISIEAEANDQLKAWWMSLDDQDLIFNTSAKASASVEAGGEHILYTWLLGDPGAKLAFTVKHAGTATQGGKVLLKGSDTVPHGYRKVGNARIFATG